jgi:hemoglobin
VGSTFLNNKYTEINLYMISKLNDIVSEKDVVLLVDSFYEKVNQDYLLSAIFNDFSGINWNIHLPKMYQFWNTLIFGTQSYKGNPFEAHLSLPINYTHFARWIEIFDETIDEHFSGIVADQTKIRAKSIAQVFESKLAHLNKSENV